MAVGDQMLIEATSQTQLGTIYTLSGNDDLNVSTGIVLTSLQSDAILAFSGQHTITVSGVVMAKDDAINLAGCTEAQTVVLQAGSVLIAGFDNTVEDADGVILDGVNSTLSNAGAILAHGTGISLIVRDGGTTTVNNTGFISADKYGVWNKFGTGVLNFHNSGTIESALESFLGGVGTDNVTNTGTMIGDVFLNDGNDTYSGATGTIIGTLRGGDGNDVFILGAAPDAVDGGAGVDTLDLRAIDTRLIIDLGNPLNNAGAALGDSYVEVENVLAGIRADTITGNLAANSLSGFNGSDFLNGAEGDDLLTGGTGQDNLTGGTGADVFAFNAIGDLRDTLTDFSHGEDRIRFDAAGFKLGAAGALQAAMFQSGTTNLASELDDRFIFNTTDTTLWYDRDGSGIKFQSSLVADLQAGAVLTASDIFLI